MDATETPKLVHRAGSLDYFSENSISWNTQPGTQATGGQTCRGLERYEHSTSEPSLKIYVCKSRESDPVGRRSFHAIWSTFQHYVGPDGLPGAYPGAPMPTGHHMIDVGADEQVENRYFGGSNRPLMAGREAATAEGPQGGVAGLTTHGSGKRVRYPRNGHQWRGTTSLAAEAPAVH